MPERVEHPRTTKGGFKTELRDFVRFVKHPTPGPRLPRAAMPALAADWVGGIDLRRIVRWVLFLWGLNLLVLGPLAAGAAWLLGADHRFNPVDLPWFLALAWAPVVEELMFRLGMRRPGAAIWLVPAFAAIVMYGSGLYTGIFLALSLALLAWPGMPGVRWKFAWSRRYRKVFPWVFHLLTLAFAVLHLLNFNLDTTVWWLMPLLILPQWGTGLVLGWMRVRTGVGASMLMHSLFNAGPMVLVWLLMQAMPADVSVPGL